MFDTPTFLQPAADPVGDAAMAPVGDREHPVLHIGNAAIEVVALAPAPSLVTLPRHEASYLKAIETALGVRAPEPGLVRTLSRAVADPTQALAKLGAPLDWTGTAHGPVISIRADVLASGVLPGPQPRGRTGRDYRSAPEPSVEHTDRGQVRLVFDDVEHFVKWLQDSIARTMDRAIRRNRHLEIAATGVRRDVACHLAVLSFRDGSADQYVVLVRDGISRWTSAQVLRLGLESKAPADAAAQIVSALVPKAKLTATTDTRALSKQMHVVATKVQQEYEGNLTPSGPTERAILLRQANRMPATIHLALRDDGPGLAAAIDRIVADVHTDVEKWDEEDADYHQARTVLEAMHDNGVLSDEVYQLVGIENTSPMRRAVSLAAFAMGEGFEPIKTEMRRQGIFKSVWARRVTELMGPVITEPWSQIKGVGTVWGYDGALPVLGRTLVPSHPDDYLDLVRPALDNDDDARDELRVAGSIALISNGVVTTSIIGGAGGSKRRDRMSLNTLFARLSAAEEGLVQLAIAANTFAPDSGVNPVPAVDMTQPDRIRRDGAGAPAGGQGGTGMLGQDLVALAKRLVPETEDPDDPTPDDDPVVTADRAVTDGLEALEDAIDNMAASLDQIERNRVPGGRVSPVVASTKAQEMSLAIFASVQRINNLAQPAVQP